MNLLRSMYVYMTDNFEKQIQKVKSLTNLMLKNKIDKKIKLNLKKKKHMNFRQQTNLAIQVMYSSVSIDFFYTIYYISFIKFI